MNDQKTCFKCGQTKPLSDFYKHPKTADGHLGKCKECTKADVRKDRQGNPEKHRVRDATRYQDDPRVKARHRRYQKTEAGKAAFRRSSEKWLAANAVKRAAHIILNNAVRDGRINKADKCSRCGSSEGRIHGHHKDHGYPLNVEWLCAQCHHDEHIKKEAIPAA